MWWNVVGMSCVVSLVLMFEGFLETKREKIMYQLSQTKPKDK